MSRSLKCGYPAGTSLSLTAPARRNRVAKSSLRTAALYCLAIWAAVWLLFLLLRFSTLDVRNVPGAGSFLLSSLVASMLAPLVAGGLAIAALARQPREPANWLTLAGAAAVLLVQASLALSSRWL
jgi:hypothetical protein